MQSDSFTRLSLTYLLFNPEFIKAKHLNIFLRRIRKIAKKKTFNSVMSFCPFGTTRLRVDGIFKLNHFLAVHHDLTFWSRNFTFKF